MAACEPLSVRLVGGTADDIVLAFERAQAACHDLDDIDPMKKMMHEKLMEVHDKLKMTPRGRKPGVVPMDKNKLITGAAERWRVHITGRQAAFTALEDLIQVAWPPQDYSKKSNKKMRVAASTAAVADGDGDDGMAKLDPQTTAGIIAPPRDCSSSPQRGPGTTTTEALTDPVLALSADDVGEHRLTKRGMKRGKCS